MEHVLDVHLKVTGNEVGDSFERHVEWVLEVKRFLYIDEELKFFKKRTKGGKCCLHCCYYWATCPL